MAEEIFKENIKQWVLYDNQHKLYNEKIKDMRLKKSSLLDDINEHIQDNNLTNAQVKISDGRLKFVASKTVKPLTMRYIEECLQQTLKHDNVDTIMTFIKENRDYNYTDDIKRYYK